MEPMYLSFLLTSFIIGMLILILLEKRKTPNKEERQQPTTLRNTTDAKPETTQDIKSTTQLDAPKTLIEEEKVTEKQEEVDVKSVLKDVIPTTTTTTSTSSSSSSSSGEEEVGKVKVQRKPKKHACKGSVVTCATKRKVTAVTIVTDSEEEEVSLDDLAGEIRTQGVICDVHPAFTHLLNPMSNDPSHLLLLFGTTSKGCERLRDSLRSALGGDVALPTPQPFLYSVTCWSAAAAGEVFESALELSASLGSCGGAEWLPVTCITTTEGDDTTTQPPVMAREQYVKTVMDKITKPGKKCCGTTCGSKTVDIEDLAASLLPRAAVTS